MTSEPQPPVFPRVSDASDDANQPADSSAGSIFSKPASTPTAPVAQISGPGAGGAGQPNSRFRWLIAIVATLGVVAVIGGVFLSLGARAGAPSVAAQYAPADTTIFVEAHLDLPGDQRDNLASFMSHFPGFADAAAFELKLDEMLAELVSQSGSGLDWAADVEPWFGGLIGAFSPDGQMASEEDASFTVAVSVKDRAALEAAIARHELTEGSTIEDYQGVSIWTVQKGDDHQVAYAVTNEALLIGSDASQVKAALDVRDNRAPGLADDQFYLQQLGALSADRLASFYYDGRSTELPLPDELPMGMPELDQLRGLMGGSAVRVVGELRAEDDHMKVVARTERSGDADLPPLPGNSTSNLAEFAPADSMVYFEMRDVGVALGYLLDTALQPSASPTSGTAPTDPRLLEQLLGAPLDEYFSFIDGAGLSIGGAGEQVEAGIVATVSDEVIASSRVDRLVGMIQSFGSFGGEMTVAEEQHGDTTIHVISQGGDGDTPLNTIRIAVDGGRLYVGVGEFVAQALDRVATDSLAANEDYRTALAAAGANNSGILFADIGALRAKAEATMTADERVEYAQNAQPFLEPLSHFMLVNKIDGSIIVSNGFLYVE